jgi:hypothetical protein
MATDRAPWLFRLLLAIGLAAGALQPRKRLRKSVTPAALGESIEAVADQPERWNCRPVRQSLAAERAFIRFTIESGEELPRYFEARRAALKAIHIRVIARDGAVRQASYTPADLEQSRLGGYFRVPLPETRRPLAK